MTLTNRLGRPMLAAMFVRGGADQLLHPDDKADAAAPVVGEIDDKVDAVSMPDDARDAVRLNGAVQLVAGGLLATNRVPRLAATALAASLVPTTLAGHRFWEIEDEESRAQQRTHFFKNLAMLGGLVITIGDTGREPSVGWRARRAARKTKSDMVSTAGDVRRSAKALATTAAAGPDLSTPDLSRAKDLAERVRSIDVASRRDDLAGRVRDLAEKAAEISRTAAAKVPDVNLAR